MKERLIRFLLSLLGLSVAAVSGGCATYEYGSPYSIFAIKGHVQDQQGNPIPGIAVHRGYLPNAVYTNEKGAFYLSSEDYGDWSMTYCFEDVDGPENGSYQTRKVTLVYSSEDQLADGEGWCSGTFERDVDVRLEEQKPDEGGEAGEEELPAE